MANPSNVGELRNRLLSAEQQIRVVGLGMAGLIALAFGSLTPLIAANAPRWLIGVLVTLIVVTGQACSHGRGFCDAQCRRWR